MCNNLNVDLVNTNAYAIFGKNPFVDKIYWAETKFWPQSKVITL